MLEWRKCGIFISNLLINPCGGDYIHILPSISQINSGQSPVSRCNMCHFWAKAVNSQCASPSLSFLLQQQCRSHFEMIASQFGGNVGPQATGWLTTHTHWTLCKQDGNLCCVKPLIFGDLLPQNSLILLWK